MSSPPERLDAIQSALAGVAGRHREPLLSVGGIGAFPNFRRARIVWMGVLQEPRLELLHHDIETTFETLGFEVEGRHSGRTSLLARVKTPLPRGTIARTVPGREAHRVSHGFLVHSIDLMQSNLTPGGASYTTVVSAALRSG